MTSLYHSFLVPLCLRSVKIHSSFFKGISVSYKCLSFHGALAEAVTLMLAAGQSDRNISRGFCSPDVYGWAQGSMSRLRRRGKWFTQQQNDFCRASGDVVGESVWRRCLGCCKVVYIEAFSRLAGLVLVKRGFKRDSCSIVRNCWSVGGGALSYPNIANHISSCLILKMSACYKKSCSKDAGVIEIFL